LNGTIRDAYINDKYDPARVCFVVRLEDGQTVTARHKLTEGAAASLSAGFARLGMDYPADLADLAKCHGASVTVRDSVFSGKTHYFLEVFPAPERRADSSSVNSLIAKLAGEVAADRSGADPDEDAGGAPF
jgi:hypothetical protein